MCPYGGAATLLIDSDWRKTDEGGREVLEGTGFWKRTSLTVYTATTAQEERTHRGTIDSHLQPPFGGCVNKERTFGEVK